MKYNFKQKYGLNVYDQQPEDLIVYAYTHGLRHIEINLSQDKLAKLADVTLTTLVKIESGAIFEPGYSKKISMAYKKRLAQIIY